MSFSPSAKALRRINPGNFCKRIKILRYLPEENPLGGEKTALKPVRTVWAWVHPIRGQELMEHYQDTNEIELRVTIRYTKNISEKDVIEYHGRQLQITTIVDIEEAHVYLEIYCTESKDKDVRDARVPDRYFD